ncbi:MAG TPA: type II secretion system protein [Fimbriimonadales bacterium]|jgi:hypothetical protein|nr:type II secretion system protein [Fimbriimonadales bacterium]
MKRSRAISLVEILAVVVIIAFLMAILLPVYQSARVKSKQPACTSNLRQIAAAWNIYLSSNDERWPNNFEEFVTKDAYPILACPADGLPHGANVQDTDRMHARVSYFYIWGLADFREKMLAADTDPGIVSCVMHGNLDEHSTTISEARKDTEGTVLRLRKDGSVTIVQVDHMCWNGLRFRPDWNFYTDAQCPPPYCPAGSAPCD